MIILTRSSSLLPVVPNLGFCCYQILLSAARHMRLLRPTCSHPHFTLSLLFVMLTWCLLGLLPRLQHHSPHFGTGTAVAPCLRPWLLQQLLHQNLMCAHGEPRTMRSRFSSKISRQVAFTLALVFPDCMMQALPQDVRDVTDPMKKRPNPRARKRMSS